MCNAVAQLESGRDDAFRFAEMILPRVSWIGRLAGSFMFWRAKRQLLRGHHQGPEAICFECARDREAMTKYRGQLTSGLFHA